jgi:hypothetical protein
MGFGITESKSILMSKTFWGSIIGLTSALFPTFYQHIVGAVGISDQSLMTSKIVGAIGAALAIYGRFAATQPMTLTGGPAMVKVDDPPVEKVIGHADNVITTSDGATVTRHTAIIETTTRILSPDSPPLVNKLPQ